MAALVVLVAVIVSVLARGQGATEEMVAVLVRNIRDVPVRMSRLQNKDALKLWLSKKGRGLEIHDPQWTPL